MDRPADLLNQLRIERNAPPPPRSWRWLWITLAVLVVVAILAVAATKLLRGDDALQVRTATATAIGGNGGSTSVLDATGYVVARRMATVSAKVTGKVREVLIEEGQKVEEGQVMARLDPVDADAQHALAAAQLSAARSQIDNMQAQLREAEANVVRMAAMVKQQLVPKAQYDQAVSQRDAMRAQMAMAQHNANVAADELKIADNGVENTVIRAPFAGVVIDKAAQPGEMISPISAGGGSIRTGIGTIVDMDSLEVEVDVSEAYIGRVQPKMPVEAVLNAYPDWKIPAEVIAIIPTADRAKATVKVRIAIKSRDTRIVPDMGVRVSFLEPESPAAANAPAAAPRVQVPATALHKDGDQDIVFVINQGNAVRHAVKLGGTLGDDRQVLAGLSGGEDVIVDAPDTLKDGDAVRVAESK
jgi:RND family efflux transporter MFP subunit